LGSKGLTVWIGDGGNFPGQVSFSKSLERYIDSMKKIYAALPKDWIVLLEHKPYEPAFYSTVISDWGTSYICAKELGDQAMCLVDLGHHLPNTNIEMIVSRLIDVNKLGGFHFNDSKFGDDDLDAGSINPYELFLIFNELTAASQNNKIKNLAYMIDQSHNVTDPIESLISSANEIVNSYTKSLLINQSLLEKSQDSNDAIQSMQILKAAFRTDVSSLVSMARFENGHAIDPIAIYRTLGYKKEKANTRKDSGGSSSGIV
jgi:L-rhamnose isomerase/sugar isomerase